MRISLAILAFAVTAVPLTAASAQNIQYPSTPTYQRPVYQNRIVNGQVVNGQIVNGGVVQQRQTQTSQLPGTAGQRRAMPASSLARPWYTKLVKNREHNFGIVAFSSRQEHIFEFENNTGADLFLKHVKTSCGCTIPKILTPHVKPGETARVQAAFDTRNFYGARGATLSLLINKAGTYDHPEIQLSVKGTIRRDVVLSPGEFDFKNITLSESVQKTAKVLYAGKPDWAIQEIKSTNPNITAEAREIDRNPATGRTNYELVVKVNERQPTGPFMETLTIFTNDAKTNGMPVRVAGTVKPVIDVAPIALGVVNKGQVISKKLIVRSPRAISIDKIETGNDKIKFAPSEGKKTLHILSYSLDTSEPFDIDTPITIVTSDDEVRRTKVPFSVQVVPSTITKGSQK